MHQQTTVDKMRYSNFSLVGFFTLAVAVVNGQEEGDFTFSYKNGTQNPSDWGHLHEEWKACLGEGHRQSPIDLNFSLGEVQNNFISLKRSYNMSHITMINRGQDIMMRFDNPYVGGFEHAGTNFYLRQLHWHHPSEHLINGKRYDMEMHMVHTSFDNKEAAVLGFLYESSSEIDDPFLCEVMRDIKNISGARGNMKDAGMIDPRDTIEDYHGYFRYAGSLTTPPCTEGVVWTVMEEIRHVSTKQLEMLKEATPEYEYNARPIQKLDHRHIKLYQPEVTSPTPAPAPAPGASVRPLDPTG